MNGLELRIPPPVVGAICLGLVWLTRDLLPNPSVPHYASNLIAMAVFSFGAVMVLGAVFKFRTAETTMNPVNVEKATTLITTGVFAWSRNPMYVALACLIASLAAWSTSTAGFLVLVLFVAYITQFQIIPEERAMERLFSNEYANYRAKVRRWI